MDFVNYWNKFYVEEKFEEMKFLVIEDVVIVNVQVLMSIIGLIYGWQVYYDGIYQVYVGLFGKEKNLLVM